MKEQVPVVNFIDVFHLSRPDEPARGLHFHASLIFFRPSCTAGSVSPRISAASIAALRALSIPTVPTGTPGGIWTIERRESIPASFTLTGTPITGFSVKEAITPGRWAERPAIAMKTLAGDRAT